MQPTDYLVCLSLWEEKAAGGHTTALAEQLKQWPVNRKLYWWGKNEAIIGFQKTKAMQGRNNYEIVSVTAILHRQ